MKSIEGVNHNADTSYMISSSNTVTEIDDMFLDLTGYSKEDIINRNPSEVFTKLLRLDHALFEQIFIKSSVDCFIFTKYLDAREVTISIQNDLNSDYEKYIIKRKPNSIIESKLPFIGKLIDDDHFGIGIYSCPDLRLIRLNKKHLDFMEELGNKKEEILGLCLKDFILDFEGSKSESIWLEIIKTGKSVYLDEIKGIYENSDNRYWDNSLLPIVEDGEVKYIISMLNDITESVLSRKYIEEQNILIKEQKEELESILVDNEIIRRNFTKSMEYIREIIHSTLDFNELMNKVIMEASKAIRCESAAISLRQGDKWVVSYIYGFPKNLIGTHMSDVEESHAILAIQTKKTVIITDTYNDDRVNRKHMMELGIRSVVVVPLLSESQVIGVIFFYNTENSYAAHEFAVEFTQNLSSSISMALINVKLFEAVCKELDERKKFDEALVLVNSRLSLALESLGAGVWDVDINANIQVWSPEKYETYGITPPEPLSFKNGLAFICSEDRDSVEQSFIEAINNHAEYWKKEFRVVSPMRGILWINAAGKFIYDKVNNCVKAIGIYIDITEQKKQNEQLMNVEIEKNEFLSKTIEMKDEFLSLISHEFKTPLTVINSAIQAMEHFCMYELSDKAKGFIRKIKQNSNRQLKLVNNLLDITRLNSGHLSVNSTNVDIVHLTESIIYSIKIYAEQKGVKLTFLSKISEKIIGIDAEKYERIILNLLSNAIKFTPTGKSITVRICQKIIQGKYKVLIKVKDEGCGIPPEKQELIFERFGQVDSTISRKAEGTGLGLYLVKMFVELLRGEIIIDSKEGVGSTFTILFPAVKVKDTQNKGMLQKATDNRLIEATAIEFSDVYL